MNTADQLKQDAFNLIEVDAFRCQMCNCLIETPDMYGTGDSPSDYECTGSYPHCDRVDDLVDKMNEVISDQLKVMAENNVDALRDSILDGDVEGVGNFILRNLY